MDSVDKTPDVVHHISVCAMENRVFKVGIKLKHKKAEKISAVTYY